MPNPISSRSIIRWAGSKRQLIPTLKQWVPQKYKRYIEPFAGSACLFFDLQPDHAVLGDINAELMQTYRQLRRHPRRLHEAVSAIPRSPDHYYRIRSQDALQLDAFERATRFIYLNRNCFNAVYRVNRKGQFNVPWGTKTGDLPSAEEFKKSARLLRNAELVTADFETVVSEAKRGDFIYLDPPYSTSVEEEPGLFGAGAFGRSDMGRLIAATKRAAKRGAIFLLSFEYDEQLIRELPDAQMKRISAHRHVSGFSGSRGRVDELLFTNATERL
jgi:DNA adenine methylase